MASYMPSQGWSFLATWTLALANIGVMHQQHGWPFKWQNALPPTENGVHLASTSVRRSYRAFPREGGVASTWSRQAGNNPPQSGVVACSASTPAVTSPSSSVWRGSLCVLEFGRTPNLMTVTLFYDFVV